MNATHVFFGWPDGGIWSNIIASVIWTVPAFTAGFITSHIKMNRGHERRHKELLKEIRKKHGQQH